MKFHKNPAVPFFRCISRGGGWVSPTPVFKCSFSRDFFGHPEGIRGSPVLSCGLCLLKLVKVHNFETKKLGRVILSAEVHPAP